MLTKGQTVEVQIDNVDVVNKRIALALAGAEDQQETAADISKYVNENRPMGTLADLLKAKLQEKTKK